MNFIELQSIIVCAKSSFTNPINLVNEKKELTFFVTALRLSKRKWSLKWELTPQANIKYFLFFSSCLWWLFATDSKSIVWVYK